MKPEKHIIFETTMTEEDETAIASLRSTLNVTLPGKIIVIADLGLWNGRRPDYCFAGDNLRNVLHTGCGDFRTWYVDKLGDLRCDDIHHDGTNHYLYRIMKQGPRPGAVSVSFFEKLMSDTLTRRDITRCTAPLGPYAADVFGWKTRGRKVV